MTPFPSLVEAAGRGASLQALAASAPGAAPVAIAPLPSTRAAEPFERLRDASDEVLARSGVRPSVFLATLGPIAAFTARATFARNLFEAGGIAAILDDGYADPDAMVAAYRHSGARLACLCSSDEVYREQATAAASRLVEAGCRRLFLAGRPGDLEPALREAGVDTFVYLGCDVAAILSEALAAATP